MATILAANTGNWSDTGTWTGGVVPVAGDIVVANGETITMDTLVVAVAELRNDTTGGAVAGGAFRLVNGSDVTANVYAGTANAACVQWLGSAGQTATVTGNFFAGSGTGAHAINCTGGNLTIGGGSQATGGTSSNQAGGILFTSPGTFIFATAGNPGIITGGTSTNASSNGVTCSGTNSTITIYATTITGNISGVAYGLNLNAAGQTANVIAGNIGTSNATAVAMVLNGASANFTCSVSGNITGGSAGSIYGVSVSNSGTYNFTVGGNIIGGTGGSAAGLRNGNATATVNVIGNALGPGNANSSNQAVFSDSTGTINITGSATAGTGQSAVNNASTGTIRVTRAIGNGFGLGSVGISNVAAVISNNSGALTYVEQLQFGSLGQTPVSGPIRLTDNTGNICQMITTTGTTKTLVDTAATAGVLPAVTDVRSGVTYSSGNLTGSCAVPAAGSVALGVPVDATTGTAVLTAANVRTAVGMASANLDTQLTPLTNLDATVSSRLASASYSAAPSAATNASAVRTELTTELGRIDATVSSRLATSGYTAPPSVGDIATAVWAAATRTLTTAIDNSSTIAAAVWGYATGRTITGGTVDTLTNAPTVPSAAAIASQVRTELTPELARISNTATVENVAVIVEGAAFPNTESGTIDGGMP